MNYEKKYKEALERMKSWAKGEHPECFSEAQKAAEFIFPELKESEDERIKKTIIRILKGEIGYTSKEDIDKYVTWLEKQGETLDANEVTKPHWISVEDELPKEKSWIIISTFFKSITCPAYHYEGEDIEELKSQGITHWMPLPEAPHHIIDANKKVDRVIGTADHIKTALDVLNKKGGKE